MKKVLLLLAIASLGLASCKKCGVVHYEITNNILPAKAGYPNTRDSVSSELCGTEYENARLYVDGDSARKVEVWSPGGVYTVTTVTRIKFYGKE